MFFFEGDTKEIIHTLVQQENIDAIFSNRDYTPFAKKRDSEIERLCKKNNIQFFNHSDTLLQEPESVLKKNGSAYQIFTPFYKSAQAYPINDPIKNNYSNYFKGKIKRSDENIIKKIMPKKNKFIFCYGGRSNAKKIISNFSLFKKYAEEKDIPYLKSTTGLSAHHKFGTISIRESFYSIKKQLGAKHPLIRQLYWRDFFIHIAYHFPHVFGYSFNQKYDSINWENNKKKFTAWTEGLTGFPIIDAGMRQLNQTGFMHNRIRMITASFLVKNLHCDWRLGEKYFATKLIDYDPAVNNGNWQWAASTGCDSQPYFRIFNPWLQQKKFDPECKYIKEWIKELKNIPVKDIHDWDKKFDKYNLSYAKPIIDYKESSIETKKLFREIKK